MDYFENCLDVKRKNDTISRTLLHFDGEDSNPIYSMVVKGGKVYD